MLIYIHVYLLISIALPDYALPSDGAVEYRMDDPILLKTAAEIISMRKVCVCHTKIINYYFFKP